MLNFWDGVGLRNCVGVPLNQVNTKPIFARRVRASGHDDRIYAGRPSCAAFYCTLRHELLDLASHLREHDGVYTAREGDVELALVLEDDLVHAKFARVVPGRAKVVRIAIKNAHAGCESLIRNWFAQASHEQLTLPLHIGKQLRDAFVLSAG